MDRAVYSHRYLKEDLSTDEIVVILGNEWGGRHYDGVGYTRTLNTRFYQNKDQSLPPPTLKASNDINKTH